MSAALSIPYAAQPDFLAAAQALLPTGDAWSRDPNAQLTLLLDAAVASLARVHSRIADLTEREAFPPISVELLPDWEQAYGLPDPCSPVNATIGQRQAAVAARIAATGGQSEAYFIGVALSLGYAITITTFDAAEYGVSTYGSPMYGSKWRYAWQVNAPQISIQYATYGNAVYGEPYDSFSDTQLACVLNRLKPTYSILIMNYEG
jgi:uncharacterized protein YmfQ (DUF2313 family)